MLHYAAKSTTFRIHWRWLKSSRALADMLHLPSHSSLAIRTPPFQQQTSSDPDVTSFILSGRQPSAEVCQGTAQAISVIQILDYQTDTFQIAAMHSRRIAPFVA